MNEQLLEAIRTSAFAIENSKNEIKKLIKNLEDNQGNTFAMGINVPGADYSLNDIFAGISSLVGLTENFETKENGPFVPKKMLAELVRSSSDIESHVDAVLNVFESVASNGGQKSVNSDDFSVTARNDTVHNFAKPFRNLFNSLDSAFAAWYSVRFVLRAPRLGDFSKYAAEFEGMPTSFRSPPQSRASKSRLRIWSRA